MDDLTSHEIEVLRAGAGQSVPGFAWGAWVSACMESLYGRGLIVGESDAPPPEAGCAYLDKLEQSND